MLDSTSKACPLCSRATTVLQKSGSAGLVAMRFISSLAEPSTWWRVGRKSSWWREEKAMAPKAWRGKSASSMNQNMSMLRYYALLGKERKKRLVQDEFKVLFRGNEPAFFVPVTGKIEYPTGRWIHVGEGLRNQNGVGTYGVVGEVQRIVAED